MALRNSTVSFWAEKEMCGGEGIVQGVWVLSEGSAFPTPSADRFRGWLSGFWAASTCAEKNSGQKAAEGERRRGKEGWRQQCGAAILCDSLSRKTRKSFGKALEM